MKTTKKQRKNMPQIHRWEDLILLRRQYASQLIYRLNAIPIKIPVGFFAETDKLNSQNNLEIITAQLEDSHFLISKHTTKSQPSRQCSISTSTDIKINGTE